MCILWRRIAPPLSLIFAERRGLFLPHRKSITTPTTLFAPTFRSEGFSQYLLNRLLEDASAFFTSWLSPKVSSPWGCRPTLGLFSKYRFGSPLCLRTQPPTTQSRFFFFMWFCSTVTFGSFFTPRSDSFRTDRFSHNSIQRHIRFLLRP